MSYNFGSREFQNRIRKPRGKTKRDIDYSGDIAANVRASTGIPVRDVRDIMRGIFHYMGLALIGGKDLTIPGFGVFRRKIRKGRTAKLRNMHTGERYVCEMPDLPIIKFIPSERLKDKMKAAHLKKTKNTKIK